VRVLELFSGIGAVSALIEGRAEVVGAIDQNPAANATYTFNTGRAPHARNLAGVRALSLSVLEADLWWMSPPCQPFTVRGLGRDLDDPRCAALLRLVGLLPELRPAAVALENVPGFATSAMRNRLLRALGEAGYRWTEHILCPTEFGVPMLRRRYYLAATRDRDPPAAPAASGTRPALRPLAEWLDPQPDPAMAVDPEQVRRWGHSATILDAADPAAVATCFTSAYGRSPVRAGSYLRHGGQVRRFSPTEVLRLLGFPPRWRFPETLSTSQRWELAGNSLSLDTLRVVLGPLLSGGERGEGVSG
jgi:site-specific DNA-cytosine methylase